jgi:heme/copper-type cytochrome/quinol oxidase subunit 3
VLAHNAALRKDGKRAAKFLWATIGGGGIFLVVKSIEWTGEIQHGFTITANNFWSFYYTAAGLHGLHVIAGMIVMMFVASDAAKGKELQRVENAGLYWHFVDLVWIFLFPLLYIAK